MTTDLTKGSIYRLIRSIWIPASTGLVFNTLYNFVDTYFAGQQVGTEALAGITIAFPIYFILIAVSSGIGTGLTALAAIALGKDDSDSFHTLAKNAYLLGITASVLILAFAPLLIPLLFRLSGASGREMELGLQYIYTIFAGAVFFTMNAILNGLLTAQGDSRSYRNFLIFGFFLNLALDPLLIMGWLGLPLLGVIGVALATDLVQLAGTIYLIFRVRHSTAYSLTARKAARFQLAAVGDLLQQGIPSVLNTATTALGVFVINAFILKLAPGPVTIASYGAGMRVEQLALIPTMGLNNAVIGIAGQNFGAGFFDRVMETRRKALLLGVSIITLGGIIIYPLTSLLIGIFDSSTAVVQAGTAYLHIELFALPTYVIVGICISTLQAVKKPNFAVLIGLYRQIVMPYILFTVLTQQLHMGINGVWLGIVLVNWSAVLITLGYSHFALKPYTGTISP